VFDLDWVAGDAVDRGAGLETEKLFFAGGFGAGGEAEAAVVVEEDEGASDIVLLII